MLCHVTHCPITIYNLHARSRITIKLYASCIFIYLYIYIYIYDVLQSLYNIQWMKSRFHTKQYTRYSLSHIWLQTL